MRDFCANLKKVLALVLAFACAFTMFAGAAFTDQADIKATDAVNMLSSLGVITGYTDGSYQPNKVVTRAEMAKMIFVVRNNKIDDSAYQSNYSKLTDISNHWAKGYIKFCESQGIIAGKGNNKFDPDSPVTGVEAAKMLLVVSGYDSAKAGLTGSAWRTNVLKYAGAAGILDDVNSALEQGLPRQYAAQMIYNTLDVNRVKWSKDSESFDDVLNGGVKETVGHAYMGLTKTTGTLVSISKDALTVDNVIAADSDAVDRAGNYETAFTKVSEDYSSLLGQRVKVLFKDGKTNSVLGVYPTSDNTVYNTIMNGVEQDGKKIKFDGKSYSIEDKGVKVYVDGALQLKADKKTVDLKSAADFDDAYTNATTGAALISGRLNRTSADEVIFVDSDDNGKIDTAIVTTVNVAKATYVSSSEIVAGNTTYKFEDENIADGIAKNDYVVITENLYDECKDIVKATKLSGVKVTGTKTSPNRYLIDGEWYTEGANADMNSVKSGDTVDAYAVNGVVYYAKRTSGENSTLSDVAVVLAKGSDIQGDKVKLLKLDNTGKTEIVDIDNDPGTGYVQKADLKEGAVYEYSVKGGEYRFKNLSTAKDYFGDYTALNNGVVVNVSNGLAVAGNASATKTIGGTQVDDSAKIVLITDYSTSGADYKVITGKQFKSLKTDGTSKNAYAKGGIAAFTSKVDGVTRVTYGVVAVNGFANSFVTNDNYGYVTKDAYKVDDGYVVYSIWNGSEEVKVQEKGTTLRKKGAVLGYSSITKEDGLSDGVVGTIEDVDDNFGLVDNGVVYGVNSKQSKVSLNGKDTADITSDTIVLYVDTDDHKGYTEGEIQEADDFGTGKIPNVMYVLDTPSDFTSDVTLLVVDVKNNLHGAFNFVFGADATKTDLVNALAKADKITVDAAAIRTVGSLDVAADKTVVVTGTDLSNVFGNLKGAKGATLIAKDGGVANKNYASAYKADGTTAYGADAIPAGTTFVHNGTNWVATK